VDSGTGSIADRLSMLWRERVASGLHVSMRSDSEARARRTETARTRSPPSMSAATQYHGDDGADAIGR